MVVSTIVVAMGSVGCAHLHGQGVWPLSMLCDAIARAEKGLVDANLGGRLIKQRVARRGQGRSGGFRTLIAIRSAERAVFLYGFAKSERGDIAPDKLAELKFYAGHWL